LRAADSSDFADMRWRLQSMDCSELELRSDVWDEVLCGCDVDLPAKKKRKKDFRQ
jgi:hypothetical protein